MKASVVGCWIVLLLTVVGCAPAQAEGELPLRIMAFNAEILTAPAVRAGSLQRYRFDYARGEHLERVANVIETLNPDVLTLIEVTSKEAVDALVEILHEKGMADYRGYHVESNDSFTGMDVALITKYPPDLIDGQPIRTIFSAEDDPTWRESFHTTNRDGNPVVRTSSLDRNSMFFITISGYKLGFFGLHLQSNPQNDYTNAKRSAQAKLVQRAVRSEIVARGYLPIVLGDINDYDPDVPDRDVTRDAETTVLRDIKDYDPELPGDELVNVAERVVRQADRYTSHWDWNENGAGDPQDVYTSIDHVLLAKELMPYVHYVLISHVVTLETSDHFPVVVDLRLPPRDE